MIVIELYELWTNEKLNPKYDSGSRCSFLERLDWTNKVIIEADKRAAENVLIEYQNIVLDIELLMRWIFIGFIVKLTPTDDEPI